MFDFREVDFFLGSETSAELASGTILDLRADLLGSGVELAASGITFDLRVLLLSGSGVALLSPPSESITDFLFEVFAPGVPLTRFIVRQFFFNARRVYFSL
uniref:Uncharacterized protein n=1 Tax=Cacopsylla melanoneura TaxID=428564 RepID=A0A8D8SG23_9HEMI